MQECNVKKYLRVKQKSNNIQKMKHECRKICYKMNFEKKISKNVNGTEKRIYSRKELEKWTCGNATCYKMVFEYFFDFFPRCTLAYSNVMNHDYSHQFICIFFTAIKALFA